MKKNYFLGLVLTVVVSSFSFGQIVIFDPPNLLPSTGNVGIGTDTPQSKLDVRGKVIANSLILTKNSNPLFPTQSINYSSIEQRNDANVVFAAGSSVGTGVGYANTRMLNFFDFPKSNFDPKPFFHFGIEDRNDKARFRMVGETGGYTLFTMLNRSQEELFRIYEDGNDNLYVDLPKPNSRIVIGGWGNYLPEHKFVVRGSSKIEGNILTDANVGIGTNNFTDNGTTYRLSVKGKIRAEEVKIYTTWADYVFDNSYELKPLEEVEAFIKENGHLPNVPSGQIIETEGLNLGEISKIQQEKIEELTLYIIELSKELKELKIQVQSKLN